jgi:hypothetical protein
MSTKEMLKLPTEAQLLSRPRLRRFLALHSVKQGLQTPIVD